MTLLSQSGGASYTVKVRAKATHARTYLFGSDLVVSRFDAKFILVMAVDSEGAEVKILAEGPGAPFDVCTLQRGQTFALQIYNLSRVWAEATEDLRIHCAILPVLTP